MIRGTVFTVLTVAVSACASDASYSVLAHPPATLPSVQGVLYLVGDAGLATPGRDAVLTHLRADLVRHVDESPGSPALVGFLGDNIYDVGARVDFRAEDLAKLSAQVRAVVAAPTVRGIFLPGNHDWGKGASDSSGRTAIETQQRWIEEIEGVRNVVFLPADGCPGPETVELAGNVHLVFIDTEWLLRQPDGCGGVDRFYQRLSDELRRLAGRRVMVLAHHPMATGGPHGGNVGLFYNGPIVYYLAVKSGLSAQDLASGRYSAMLARLRSAIARSGTRPLAMATGHDHSLQVIRLDAHDQPLYQLVSGSASKSSQAGRIRGTRFATSAHGYMRVDFTPDETRVVVFALDADTGSVRAAFSCTLAATAADTCAEAPRAGGGP